jgi:hypothetical protein
VDCNEETPPITLGAPAYALLAATLLCVAVVPFFWWLGDQRLIPWQIEAQWEGLRSKDGAPSVEPGAFIEMSRDSCFGRCPVYRVKLFANGRVEYAGEHYVCAVGDRTARVDPGAASKLISDLQKAGLFELDWKAEYTVSDSSTVYLRLTVGSRTRALSHYLGDAIAPRILESMEDAIDDIAGTDRWLPKREGNDRYCIDSAGIRHKAPPY